MKPIDASTTQTLYIGYAGEINHTIVAFPTHCLTGSPENGTFTLFVQRNGDEQAYPAPITVEDDKVLWTVREVDAAKIGHGEVQLVFTVPGETAKSKIWAMNVFRSLTVSEDQPEPSEDWVNTVIEAADRAEQAAADIEDLTVSAVSLPSGSDPTVTKTKEEGEPYNLEFGIPEASVPLVQTTGQSTTDVMSQKAVTDVTNAINQAISLINALIPSAASSTNKLADKNFVNSSIGTNTANYISYNGQPFPSFAALQSYTGTVTNNDYAFVTGTDEQGNTYFDRYKASVSGSSVSWAKEYRLNNSSFTADQWASINSGITSSVVEQIIEALDTIAELERKAPEWDAKYTKPTDGIPATDLDEDIQDALETVESAFTTIEDTDVYLSRESAGGKEIGNREILNKIVGGTIIWNQVNDGTGADAYIPAGRIFYTDQGVYPIQRSNGAGIPCSPEDVFIDLTQMFGPAIAEYIYTLEQAHAGDGVAFIKPFIERADKSYNAGELVSVKASAHETVGFNAWDEVWENGEYNIATGEKRSDPSRIRSTNFIKVVPNATYYFKTTSYHYVLEYDGNKKYIRANTSTGPNLVFTVGDTTHYITFYLVNTSTYGHDICINISNPSRNGTYEPYVKHTYTIDNVELRGKLKLDTNNKLYYDGDEYASDGTVTRKYAIVDMGTLSWMYRSAQQVFTLSVRGFSKTNGNVLCTKYPQHYISFASMLDKSIATFASFNANDIIVKDSAYTSAAAFTSAMSGVYLVYELATSTTDSASPISNPQIVDANGTESFVDERDVPMPVQAEAKYLSKPMGDAVGDFLGISGSQINLVTEISASSTDDEVPSAKAVFTAIQTAIGDAIGGSY